MYENDAATIGLEFGPKMPLGLGMRPSVIVALTGNGAKQYIRTRIVRKRDQEVYKGDHDGLTPNEL